MRICGGNSYRVYRHQHTALLRSCSQIYTEAALVLYMHNTFSFGDADLLPQFISTLVPAQTSAITSLTLNNVFVGDLLDRDYWEAFPHLRHLTVSIRSHDGCTEYDSDMHGHRLLNAAHLDYARMVWQRNPSLEPLEHFNLASFKFRIVCGSGKDAVERCPTLEIWQRWSEAIEQRVLARPVRAGAQRRRTTRRHFPYTAEQLAFNRFTLGF
jgi:hypothetical protein